MKILFDTDILSDLFFDRVPYSENIGKILSLCEQKIVTGCVTALSINNLYILLRQNAKQDKVLDKLRLLVSILEIITIDQNVVLSALNYPFNDFEVAIQNYATKENGQINILITQNTKKYSQSDLTIMNPTDFLKFFNSISETKEKY